MKHLISLIFSSALILPAISLARQGVSAHREPNESYEMAMGRNLGFKLFDLQQQPTQPTGEANVAKSTDPESLSKPLKSLSLKDVPDVGSYDALVKQFQFVRDTRFLETTDVNFPRRLTWLYPDDGCYARAELAAEHLIKNHFASPKKVFAFGDLSVDTANSPSGSVQWWYHVAVIYRVGTTPYVLDPALDPKQPMTLADWNKTIGGEHTKVQYTICSKDTFDPDVDCLKPEPIDEKAAEDEQRSYLNDEWQRLVQLNRDPVKELGDSPPWLQ